MGLGIGDQTTISQGTAIKYDITPVASLAKGDVYPSFDSGYIWSQHTVNPVFKW